MSGDLKFRINLKRGPSFTLDVAGSIPLTGVTAVVGPSGSGKTTFLRAVAGLEPPGTADVAFRSDIWSGGGAHVAPEARGIGFVFQEPRLFTHLDVAGNLAFGAKRRGDPSYGGIIEALDLRGLLDRDVASLSGGEARRVALGRALAADPALLLLDEPLTGLDTEKKRELLPYIGRAVAEARVPAIYVTHSVEEITALADRVLALENGRLQGWLPPQVRLRGKVTRVDGPIMHVSIGNSVLQLPVAADPGEWVGIGVPPESLMVSAAHPGGSDALAVLLADVCTDVEGDGLTVEISGQRIELPRQLRQIGGSRLWLSILAGLPRPEARESLDDEAATVQSKPEEPIDAP